MLAVNHSGHTHTAEGTCHTHTAGGTHLVRAFHARFSGHRDCGCHQEQRY